MSTHLEDARSGLATFDPFHPDFLDMPLDNREQLHHWSSDKFLHVIRGRKEPYEPPKNSVSSFQKSQ